jgi:hypothetical protein
MRRVVRPGGTVTAVAWDTCSGLTHWRMMCHIAVALDPYLVPALFSPMTAPDEMATLWRELGTVEVEQISLVIRMEFSSFEDYWRPFTTDEGFEAIHRRILRGSLCPAEQECEARRSRRPSRRFPLVRDGDLGRPRRSALALSAA